MPSQTMALQIQIQCTVCNEDLSALECQTAQLVALFGRVSLIELYLHGYCPKCGAVLAEWNAGTVRRAVQFLKKAYKYKEWEAEQVAEAAVQHLKG